MKGKKIDRYRRFTSKVAGFTGDFCSFLSPFCPTSDPYFMSCSILGALYHLNCSRTPHNVCGALFVNLVLISNPLYSKAKTPCCNCVWLKQMWSSKTDVVVFQEGTNQCKHPGPLLLFHFRSEYLSLTDPGRVCGLGHAAGHDRSRQRHRSDGSLYI